MASGLSIVLDREGRIAAIGPDHEVDVDSRMDGCSFEQCIRDEYGIRSGGHTHTHPIWVRDRVYEFGMKIKS